MNIKKYYYYIFRIITICIMSFYLMNTVDTITVTTNIQRIFIFCYFLVFCGILTFIIEKKCSINSKVVKLVTVILSILLIAVLGDKVIPHQYVDYNVKIQAIPDHIDNSPGNEVWIKAIKVGNETLNLEKIATKNWVYDINSKCLVASPVEDIVDLDVYVMDVPSIEITFIKHQWAGTARITIEDNTSELNLYTLDSNDEQYVLNSIKKDMNYFQYIVLYLGFIIIVCNLLYVICAITKVEEYLNKIKINRILSL